MTSRLTPAEKLRKLIEGHSALVGVIGLGYVGLPVTMNFVEAGFRVLGFDVDEQKIAILRRGDSYIPHLDAAPLRSMIEKKQLEATSDLTRLDEPDAILICVPTPLSEHREPDLRYVEETARSIANTLRTGQLVILESTTFPGTTDEIVRSILETSGLTCSQDFFLAYSPEREDPGSNRRTSEVPKVVGGVDEISRELAVSLYDCAGSSTVTVSSTRVAEASKLTENIFRAVNIALVNELKIIYDRMGIDISEVLDACETKPFGFMRFDPGPGWGGHCIPVDPFYLSWKAREHGLSSRFIELAGEINIEMPRYVVRKLQEALNDHGKPVKGCKVLILGLAYKKNVGDPRESPAFEIIDRLLHLGAEVSYHDPHISEAPRMRNWPNLPPMRSRALDAETLEDSDAIVVVTDHDTVDYTLVARYAPLIVDARRSITGREDVISA